MPQPSFAQELVRGCDELLPYALSLTRNLHILDEHDLIQMTARKALAMEKHYDPSRDILPWLSRAMRNQMWDHYRATSRVVLVPIETAPEPSAEATQETCAELRKQLWYWYDFFNRSTFSRRARAVFLLFILYEYTHAEIADAGNMPLGTVKSTIRRVWEAYRAEVHIKGSAT
jgi:RNA polymerase sigma factor (sigma-70 family)